jgi:parallel beta-helix repeat protein
LGKVREIEQKSTQLIMLTLLLMSMLILTINIQPVKASGTIYIRIDGSVDPPTAPISSVDNVTYTFSGDIYDRIIIEKSNIIVDGNGYTLQGDGSGNGFYLEGISNVTIRSTNIKGFVDGISLWQSSYNTVLGNNITDNVYNGIWLWGPLSNNSIIKNTIANNQKSGIYIFQSSDSNTVLENSITSNDRGVFVQSSYFNTVSENNVTSNKNGIWITISSSNNTVYDNNVADSSWNGVWIGAGSTPAFFNVICGNRITNNTRGILADDGNNTVFGNTIKGNTVGIDIEQCSFNIFKENSIESNSQGIVLDLDATSNQFYHNKIINNTDQVYDLWERFANVWDDGYPSGGNYWSDYVGKDLHSGPYQNETGSDGLGDSPYIIDANNRDNYPFMKPYGVQHDVGITDVTPSGTIVGQGFSLNITVATFNYGIYTETCNITVYANTTAIASQNVSITSRNSTTITFAWNTTGWAIGNYTISANTTIVPDETDIADNSYIDDVVTVRLPIHDVSVTDAATSKTVVCQDYSLNINVTVANQGDYTETFNVTVYANTTIIETKEVTLTSVNLTLNFTWNTTGFVKGNYTISAIAEPVPLETETSNNNMTDGWVIVAMVGDISGRSKYPDGKVDAIDVAGICSRYGAKPPDPRYDPNWDITGPTQGLADGKIDARDVSLVSSKYGQKDP